MEYLSLEIFDLEGTGSQFATLDDGASISITDTSEIFASGDVWSFSFTLNVFANAHIFGTTGEIHGSRLHEQIDHRRVRLWVMGLPIYLGYLKLGDEVEVKANGDVSVSFESGHKTFDDMIEGMSAQDVSVGDVKIGIALSRKRYVNTRCGANFVLSGLGFSNDKTSLNSATVNLYGELNNYAYVQRWPKLVMSQGSLNEFSDPNNYHPYYLDDIVNVDKPYGPDAPFCNINICYQRKDLVKDESGNEQEKKVRGYILRLGHGKDTTKGGEGETRFNNAPNFFLLYWLDRLFLDKGIIIEENQMMNVDDLRRVFLANLGCFYEEKDLDNDATDNYPYPSDDWTKYGKFSFPSDFISIPGGFYDQNAENVDYRPQVRVDSLTINGQKVSSAYAADFSDFWAETNYNSPTGYWAYATGENYPKVDASEIIKSVEAAFGVRFLFDKDYTKVRIILLRNVFQDTTVQDIECEVTEEQKTENKIRGFVMTYGGSDDDTNYNYSDWSNLDKSKTYQEILDKTVTTLNKTCYLTPNNGNAYRIKIDEDEELYYPVLMEVAGFADAKDGNCDGEDDTIQTVTIPAKPLIMNYVDGTYAFFFSGDMNAPDKETPMQCSIPLIRIEEQQDYNVGYYDFDHSAAVEQYETLKAEYDYFEEKYLEALEKEKYPHYQGFSFAYKMQMQMKQREIEELGAKLMNEQTTTFSVNLKGELFAHELYAVKLMDSYNFSGNDGTPFDKAELGLYFGVMRGSGPDSYIYYNGDYLDNEGNDYWEIHPGQSVVDHPDMCDNWGNSWDYSDDYITERDNVPNVFAHLFTLRDSGYFDTLLQYGVTVVSVPGADGKVYNVLMRLPVPVVQTTTETMVKYAWLYYQGRLHGLTPEKMLEFDATGIGTIYDMELNWNNLIIEIDSSWERFNTLVQLIWYYNGVTDVPPIIHNGVSTRYSRFSLKPRAEKQNPDFDPKKPETHYDPEHPEQNTNPRFVADITDPNLQRRGLADQFYKEYSYWIRNARIVTKKVNMTLAQLLSIDKTKRIRIGDVTGYVRKIQYTVSNKTGLGPVTLEIMYI